MFNLFKKKFTLFAPVTGEFIELSKVPDAVFAEKLAGDGAAIDSLGDVFVAPADGVLTLIFRTNHAFGMTLSNGIEILVHIGMDTVELNGEGFTRIAEEGSTVKAGDPIIKINRELLNSKGCNLVTPILITNMEKVDKIECSKKTDLSSGKDIIITYTLK